MDFIKFAENVKTMVGEMVGNGHSVRLTDVRKNNGLVLKGITIREDGTNISPTIYLNGYYDAYMNCAMTMPDVVNGVIDTYNKNKVKRNVDMGYFMDYGKVRDSIAYKLINTGKNVELLKDIPHVEFLDMSIVFISIVSKNDEVTASILIHNSHMELWNVGVEDLYRDAMDNTRRLMGCDVVNMDGLLEEITGIPELGEPVANEVAGWFPMYIITNRNRVDGAACILYPHFLEELAESIGGSFYILPSSIHETIMVPADDTTNVDEIAGIVREVNDTQVRPEEVLSNSVYFFYREKKHLAIVGG